MNTEALQVKGVLTNTLLSVDPGADAGWAWFLEGRLVAAGLTHENEPPPAYAQPDAFLIECPRHYPHGVKCDPNDLITLAVKVGEWRRAVRAQASDMVAPSDWKGQTPKDVVERRVWKALRADEAIALRRGLANVPAKQQHNVIEAVAIGLWRLYRYR